MATHRTMVEGTVETSVTTDTGTVEGTAPFQAFYSTVGGGNDIYQSSVRVPTIQSHELDENRDVEHMGRYVYDGEFPEHSSATCQIWKARIVGDKESKVAVKVMVSPEGLKRELAAR